MTLLMVVMSAFLFYCTLPDVKPQWISGADISSLPEIETSGGKFYEQGIEKDLLDILKNNGCNYIRLRLWHTPENEFHNLKNVALMAKRVKEKGFYFLLDLHYSDTWADPGLQKKPSAWEGIPFHVLKDSVYSYTRKVIQTLKRQNTLPDIVQIGNEIDPGMLWEEGKVGSIHDTDQQWSSNLPELLKAGISGVRSCLVDGESIDIMIHVASGGKSDRCQRFFNQLSAFDVPYDIIGVSYYPWFFRLCGTMEDLEANINNLAETFEKDIIVVETAYAWTMDNADERRNRVRRSDQLHAGYPATVEGQYQFLTDLQQIIRNVKNGRGKGFFYWEPGHITTPNRVTFRDNLALFDFKGNVLESIRAFNIERKLEGNSK